MRILDKYILKEMLGPFIFGIAAFSSIFIGTNVLKDLAKYITQYGASILTVAKLFVYSLPGIVVLTFPMSMLLAALLAFGRLSGSSEITAMRSSGQSFSRLAVPVIIAAFFVSILALAFNEAIVPAANTAHSHIVRNEIEKDTRPQVLENIIIKDIKQGEMERLIYAKRFQENTKTMHNVAVQEFAEGNVIRVQNAEKAVWQNGKWTMYNGTVTELSSNGQAERTVPFSEQKLPTDKNPRNISLEQKDADDMTMKELKQHIAVLKSQYVTADVYEVKFHQRISIPMASFIFALIGTPLGLTPQRASSSIGFGISVLIIFVYYTIMTTAATLGQAGAIHPFLAAWIPNIIGIMVGIYLVYKASR